MFVLQAAFFKYRVPSLTESRAAAGAAKLLQSCPTLCDPIDGSSPGSPIPGTLETGLKDFARADILRQIVLDNQPTCCHGYCTEGP